MFSQLTQEGSAVFHFVIISCVHNLSIYTGYTVIFFALMSRQKKLLWANVEHFYLHNMHHVFYQLYPLPLLFYCGMSQSQVFLDALKIHLLPHQNEQRILRTPILFLQGTYETIVPYSIKSNPFELSLLFPILFNSSGISHLFVINIAMRNSFLSASSFIRGMSLNQLSTVKFRSVLTIGLTIL